MRRLYTVLIQTFRIVFSSDFFVCEQWSPFLFVGEVIIHKNREVVLLDVGINVILGHDTVNMLQRTNRVINAYLHAAAFVPTNSAKRPELELLSE